jgi:hypothetical protein
MRNLAVILLLPCLCPGADVAPSVDSVIEMARAAPGEFAADALIRLGSLTSLDKPRRVQLLEQAFHRAGEAQEPLKRQSSILKVPGSAGFLNRAYSQDLDGMSLRLRALQALEPLDPAKARALFQQIPPVRLPKLKCADFLVYNVSAYYQLAARLAAPRAILDQIAAITSPVQITPAAQLVTAAATDADFRSRFAVFATALGKISGDDRSFTFVRDPGPSILSLVEECKRHKLSPLPLLENYRLYLVNNQQTARCGDDDLLGSLQDQRIVLQSGTPLAGGEGVEFFNAKLRVAPLQPIQEQETTPTALEGVAEGLRGCQDTTCLAIANEYSNLIFDPRTRMPLSPKAKAAPDWVGQFHVFMAALEEWKPVAAVTPAQYYRQKTAAYADLLNMVPTGPLQEEVVVALLSFVENSGFKGESRMEWFLPVNVLVGRMAMDPLSLGRFSSRLRQSKDPVIALYSILEAVAPRTPDKIMSLM